MLSTRQSAAQAAAAMRACCGEASCYVRRHLRLLDKVPPRMARSFVAEIAACERGLGREELIQLVIKTARRNLLPLARQSLREIERRRLRPSITAHNALLEAYARSGRWSDCLHLLTMMKQKGPQPDAQSYTATLRASAASPLAAEIARQVVPEFDAIAKSDSNRRDALPAHLEPSVGPSHRLRSEKLEDAAFAERGDASQASWPRRDERAGDGLQSAREAEAVLELATPTTQRTTQEMLNLSVASLLANPSNQPAQPTVNALLSACSSEPGAAVAMLDQLVSMPAFVPNGRTFIAALRGCASSSGRHKEALAIAKRLEAWVGEDAASRAKLPEVNVALTSAIASCDKSSATDAALALLSRFERLGVPLATESTSAAICACRSAGIDGVKRATRLLDRMKAKGVQRTAWTYNAMLEVYAAAGTAGTEGMGRRALSLLRAMELDRVKADAVTYTGVLKALRPTAKEAKAMLAESRRMAASRRTSNNTPAVKTTAQALASTTSHDAAARDEVNGAVGDGVLHLGSHRDDAQARRGASKDVVMPATAPPPIWSMASALLDEMELRGLPPSLHAHNVAIELAALSCDVGEALALLKRMEHRRLCPDGYSWASAMKAASRAGDADAALEILDMCLPPQQLDAPRRARSGGREDLWLERVFTSALHAVGLQRPLQISEPTGRLDSEIGPSANNAASDASQQSNDPFLQTLAVWERMEAIGVKPSAHTFDALLRSCAVHGAWQKAIELLSEMRERDIRPLAAHYDAAIRACLATDGGSGIEGGGGATASCLSSAEEAAITLVNQAQREGIVLRRAARQGKRGVNAALNAHVDNRARCDAFGRRPQHLLGEEDESDRAASG